MRKTLCAAVVCMAAAPGRAFAHTGQRVQPDDVWSAWTWDPLVVVILAASLALYIVGVNRLWSRQTGIGVKHREAACFLFGWIVAAIALMSPLHALGGSLFTAHMIQHELLISVSAPLIVLGRPLIAFMWAFPPRWRRSLGNWANADVARIPWRVLTLPIVAFTLHAAALWVWHLPGPYQSTLTSDLKHAFQHASFIVAALLFWWTVLKRRGDELGSGVAVLSLFATVLQTGALGALLSLSSRLWYPAYAATTGAWGLDPLEDQQLGGLIMWIPGSIAYVVAGLFLFARWLNASEERARRREAAAFAARAATVVAFAIAVTACDRSSGDNRYLLTNSDPRRGRVAITKYGCGSCHDIPGISGAAGLVGPPLGRIAQRAYIAGVLTNEPGNMIRWLENPPGVDPKTAMPYMAVTPRDARDIAAYLYTLR